MGSLLGIAFYWYQKGLLKKEDAYGLELEWGNEKAAIELFYKILNQEKGLGELLSMGVQRALDKMGPDYAVPQGAIKGVSAILTDVRIGKSWGLGFAVSPRGADHLKSFAVLQWQPAPTIMKITGSEKAINPTIEEDKHLITAWSGDYSTVLDSIGICKQPTIHDFGAYPTDLVAKMFSAVTGVEMTFDQLMKAGERNWNVMRLFNTRQGLTRKDDTLPAGMSSVPKPDGVAKGLSLNLDKMLDQYYPYRGWDNNGIPTREKLEELGLADMADQLGIKKKAAKKE
jgi:aldehyde:ferredoxin oxidoreductase